MLYSYITPADEVRRVGRQLSPGSFEELKAQLVENEELFGLYDAGTHHIAPLLPNPEVMEGFERHKIVFAKRLDFFAVPKQYADEHVMLF